MPFLLTAASRRSLKKSNFLVIFLYTEFFLDKVHRRNYLQLSKGDLRILAEPGNKFICHFFLNLMHTEFILPPLSVI